MPSKISITAVFLFAYFLCEIGADAELIQKTIYCTSSSSTFAYSNAYLDTELKTTTFGLNTSIDITDCDPANANTGCTHPTGRQLECTENGWQLIKMYNRTCSSDSFLNKDDFKCYKCSSVTGNNNAIVNKTNPTNTAKDCYIPSNNQLENDRGFFNYDTSCYYASTGLNNATGFTPWWESA